MGHQYDDHFMSYTDASSRRTAGVVAGWLQGLLTPASVLDVGCARGGWLAAWREAGAAEIQGVDGDYVDRKQLAIPEENFRTADLSHPLDLARRYDLVQSLEVAEHIAAEHADTFVANLVRHSNGLILFSAAPPGQGGEFHINEQPYDYWRERFARHGFVAFDPVRPKLAGDASISFWYRFNTLLYVHHDVVASLPPEIAATRIPEALRVADVSPLPFRLRKLIVRSLPYAWQQGLARFKARVLPSGRF